MEIFPVMFGQAEAEDGHSKKPMDNSNIRTRMIACSKLTQKLCGSRKFLDYMRVTLATGK